MPLAVAAVALSGPSAQAFECGGTAGAARIGRPTPSHAWQARLARSVPAFARPGRGRVGRVRPDATTALLVLGARDNGGHCWIHVRLPSRPNTAKAWVDGDRMVLASTRWRIAVHTRSRRLDVFRAGRRVR